MENNKDKPYSLQDAIAIEMKHKNFDLFTKQCQPYEVDIFVDKIISKATEELRKELDSLKIELSNSHIRSIGLRVTGIRQNNR